MLFTVLSTSLLLPGLLSLPFHTVTLTMPDNEVTINVNCREREGVMWDGRSSVIPTEEILKH